MKFTSALCLALVVVVASAEYDCSGVSNSIWRSWCNNNCNHAGSSHCPPSLCSACVDMSAESEPETEADSDMTYTSSCEDDTIYHAVDDQYCTDNCNMEEPFCPACCMADGATPTPTPAASDVTSYESFCEDDEAFYAADDDWCTNNCNSASAFCPGCCLMDGYTPTPTPTPESDDDDDMTMYYSHCEDDSVFHAVDNQYCTDNCNMATPFCPSCCGTSASEAPETEPESEDDTPQYTSNCANDAAYYAADDAWCTNNCNMATPHCPDCCEMN